MGIDELPRLVSQDMIQPVRLRLRSLTCTNLHTVPPLQDSLYRRKFAVDTCIMCMLTYMTMDFESKVESSGSLRKDYSPALRGEYHYMLAHLEKDPGSIETFYREMLLVTGSKNTEEYLNRRLGITQRVFPGIDFSTLEASRTEMLEREETLSAMLEKLFSTVVSNYNWKGYELSNGEFLRLGEPFRAADYGDGSYTAMFDVLDPDSFFLVLVDVENGFIRNTPTLDQLADEHQQFTKPVDFSKTYIVGCVFRSMSGIPLLMYEIEVPTSDSYYSDMMILALSEEEFSALQVPGKCGVWTG